MYHILGGISNLHFEIPHEISYPYIGRLSNEILGPTWFTSTMWALLKRPHLGSSITNLVLSKIRRFLTISIPIVAIGRSCDRFIATMAFPLLVRRHIYTESVAWIRRHYNMGYQSMGTPRDVTGYWDDIKSSASKCTSIYYHSSILHYA